MSKIRVIDTGKRKLLAVMVPEIARDYEMRDDGKTISFGVYNPYSREYWSLPQGNWQILGLSTELTDEQWIIIVEPLWNGFKNYLLVNEPVGNYKRLVKETAKRSGESLLEANEVYSTNPISDEKPKPESYVVHEEWLIDCARWEEAKENVGSWLILKQVE